MSTAGDQTFEADNVVVAMANFQQPRRRRSPPSSIRASCSSTRSDYKNPSQLADGPVLVVGVGNSGADIAIDVAQHHPTWLAGKESAAFPFRIEPFLARNVALRGVRFVGHHVLTRPHADRPQGPPALPHRARRRSSA